jgi:hypothetical protein
VRGPSMCKSRRPPASDGYYSLVTSRFLIVEANTNHSMRVLLTMQRFCATNVTMCSVTGIVDIADCPNQPRKGK